MLSIGLMERAGKPS